MAAKVFGDIGDSSYTEIHRTEHIVLMSKAAGPKLNQTVLKVAFAYPWFHLTRFLGQVYLSIPEVSLDDIVWIKGESHIACNSYGQDLIVMCCGLRGSSTMPAKVIVHILILSQISHSEPPGKHQISQLKQSIWALLSLGMATLMSQI